MPEKIVVFGAGATGRGHVGLLAWEAGYQIVFVDSKPELIDVLQTAGQYTVRLFGGADPREIVVTGYRAYHHLQREAIAEEIRDAVLVLTAVFDQTSTTPSTTRWSRPCLRPSRSRRKTVPVFS